MKQTYTPRRAFHSWGFIILAVHLMIGTTIVICQSDKPLPPAAQEAVNKGIIAAKVPDYPLAIRFFEEARKLAPQAPVIYLNMGLAESRIPGRELRAMAWFGAYLAAYPEAPNAAAVKEQIAVLDVKAQSDISRFLKTVQDASLIKLPDKQGDLYDPGEENDSQLNAAATLWIDSGDIAAALKTVSLFNDPNPGSIFSNKSHTLRDIAIAQAERGDFSAALKTAVLIKDDRGKTQALQSIAISQARSGDIAGAKKTVDLIKGEWEKSWAQSAIAKAQAKAGDIASAQITFTSSLKTADLVLDASKSRLQALIAEAQIDAGDIAGAQRTLTEAQKTAERIKDEYTDKAIADAQAKIDATSAAGLRQTMVEPPTQKSLVAAWLKKLDDGNQDSDCPLNTDPFVDLADYLKSLPARWAERYPGDLPAAGHPEQVFRMLHKTAEKIVKAQNIITGMLKQQAKKQ